MKAIAKLKDDARRHEQREEWEKAINAYLQVLRLADQGDAIELDLPLYNRVGDLYVRLGLERDAVKYYEQAADRYAEAGLYNNAIALCNKALRYDVGRLELLKKLGSFSASQGFFTDARRWYLEYAEKSIKRGAVDEAFSALTDLAQVSDDPEIRELLAGQLRDHGRTQQAVEQYKRAYSMRVAAGEQPEANAIRAKIEKLDPGADMSVAAKIPIPDYLAARHKEEELPGFVDHAPPPMAAAPVVHEPEPEILEIEPPELIPAPEIEAEAAGFEDLDLEFFGETEDVDTADVDTAELDSFDVGMDVPFPVGPMEVEEEHELFDLKTFGLRGAAEEGEELPLLGDEPALDRLEDAEPLPGLEMIETMDTQLGSEEGEPGVLDIGEIIREETDFEDTPLPMLDVDLPEEEAPALDFGFQPDSELEYWSQPRFPAPTPPEAYIEAEPELEVEAESEPEAEAEPEPGPEFEWEVETVSRFAADQQFEFEEDATTASELEPESELEIGDEIEAAFETETVFEAEPHFEAEPSVEAEPFAEAEGEDIWAEFEAERQREPEPEIGAHAEAESWSSEDIEPEIEAEADLDLPPELDREPGVVFEPELPLMAEPEPLVAFEAASVAEPVEAEQAPPLPAKKAESEYIDLAALLGEDEEAVTDSTRFVVAERAPTGDEEKDFADMLQQFKQKVAETIPREDAGSHYDLGLAFKEMGLIDEAIGEFQTALRSGQEKLKVYEELGTCFVMKQQYSVAISVLNRAQQMPFSDEADLLGVYYNLGRAHEELGQRAEAKSAYEKIIAVDIGFQDTSARLARL